MELEPRVVVSGRVYCEGRLDHRARLSIVLTAGWDCIYMENEDATSWHSRTDRPIQFNLKLRQWRFFKSWGLFFILWLLTRDIESVFVSNGFCSRFHETLRNCVSLLVQRVWFKWTDAVAVSFVKSDAGCHPEQIYWQETVMHIGLDSSVGRAPALQYGGIWFKSDSSQLKSLFNPKSCLVYDYLLMV